MSYQLYLLLTWAANAVSFFNMIAFLWLGFTVLLNVEHRRWGTWLAGGGLILAGLFFAGHSAVVSHALDTFESFAADTEFWWRASWLPVVGAPYLWYLMTAWYTGVLQRPRQRLGVVLVGMLGLAALLSLVLANPLPSYGAVLNRQPVPVLRIGGLPVVVLIYPVYSTLCIVLALVALRRPTASERFMGDEARRRARPWLMAAGVVLLLVTLTLGAAVAVFLSRVQSRLLGDHIVRTLFVLIGFDLLLCGLIAVAIVLIGRAIVSYEIFTGKALPRGGLFRYWRRSLVLAAGYGLLMGLSLTLPGVRDTDPIYRVLLATLLMTLFYALLGWRSFADRERSMEQLRPFVASPRLYERMLRPAAPPEVDIAAPLRVLCDDVLDARLAYLVALGPLAPLAGAVVTAGAAGQSPGTFQTFENGPGRAQTSADGKRPVRVHPGSSAISGHEQLQPPGEQALAALAGRLRSPQLMCEPIEAAQYGGAVWAVPLWSERGLIGALLLGEKHDDGLYTQEEIEIARATGERLIDTRASAEMARRLMALQRQRLAESQVVDRRTRRVLHDDVLPRLHTAMLMLGDGSWGASAQELGDRSQGLGDAAPNSQLPGDGSWGMGDGAGSPAPNPQLPTPNSQLPTPNSNLAEAITLLAEVHRDISNLLHAMPPTAAPEVARLGLIGALRQAIDGEFGHAFDGVAWQAEAGAEQAARQAPALAAEVLFYAAREVVRNAARYGRNGDAGRALHLRIHVGWRNGIELTIEDDGVGMGAATIAQGAQGSGHGLGLHSTLMAVVGGTLVVESAPGAYTRVVLALPAGALQ